MNLGQSRTQIKQAWDILKVLELGADRILRPSYPQNAASIFRHLYYPDIWKLCYQNQHYDFQLTDGSLIQFRIDSFSPLAMSYSYYECPYKTVMLYDAFRREYEDLLDDETELREEYSNYFAELELKTSWTPLRYDYSPQLYIEGRHPASHVHLGYNNNIRIGTKKVLMPVSFLHFVLRQVYPDSWIKLTRMGAAHLWCRNIRENLTDVDPQYWNTIDHWEMYLL